MEMEDAQTRWLDDAPDPATVLTHVLTLVARQVKKLSDRRLRLEDHAGRMRVLLAAEFFYDFYYQMVDSLVPEAALESADLHLRFAKQALRLPVEGETAPAMEALAALAEECFVSRGRICTECGLPQCLHSPRDGLHPEAPARPHQQE
jgi:hypothetical protein